MRATNRICMTMAVVLSGGCYSGLSDSNSGGAEDGDGADDGSDGDGDGSDGDGDGAVDDGANPDELPAPNTRYYRLSHTQWENTVRDLMGLDAPTGFGADFRLDAEESGYIFANNAMAVEVDLVLWAAYQRAATDVAELAVVTDPTIMDGLVTTAGDADAFVRSFGRRAFRRPLTEAEVSTYVAMFADAPEYYTDSTGFEAGVRLIIEAMLQSPHFLYRIEASEDEVAGVIPLSNYEVAARLSYFLWDSMPDDELLDAAEVAGLEELEGVAEQAARMLDDPRAAESVRSFHIALHDVADFADADPNPTVYPNAPADLGLLAQQEHEAFVRDVIFDQDGGYEQLLTSSSTFVNQDTAPLYGLNAADYGASFERAELDGTQRRGVFTQLGFLVANATGVQPDPIHRGVFLAQRVACADLPAPPDDIPPLPVVEGQTNREAIEDLTEQEGTVCAGCHSVTINPWGFPFENYDSTGAWRDLDSGLPVDPAAEVAIDGAAVPVGNALELIDAMASSYQVHSCYVDHWVQFANGRPGAAEDQPLVQRLTELSMETTPVKDVLIELVTSRPFRTRAIEEVQ